VESPPHKLYPIDVNFAEGDLQLPVWREDAAPVENDSGIKLESACDLLEEQLRDKPTTANDSQQADD